MKGRKERKMKKTLAILLSLALVICMIPATAFAETTTPNYDLSKAEITLSQSEYTYDGTAKTPSVIVKDGNTKQVLSGTDNYEVAYNANTAVGTATVTITGKEGKDDNTNTTNYFGKVEKTFTIKPYDLSKVNILIDDQIGAPAENSFSNLQPGTVNYYYSGNKLSETAVNALFNSKLNAVLTPNAAGTSYTVDFTVSDTQNFSGSITSTSFDVVTNIADAEMRKTDGKTVISAIDGGEYNNTEKNVKSLFKLYASSTSTTPLEYGKDYTISYAEAKKAGNWDVIIKGMGTYGGTNTVKLNISQRNANNYVTYDAVGDQTVNTLNSIEPVIRDRNLGTTLEKGTDYVIRSRSGQAGEKGSIVIGFTGNYGGNDLTVQFNVVSDASNVEKMVVYYGASNVSSGTLSTSAYMYNAASQPLSNIVVYKNNEDYVAKRALSTSYYTINYEYDDTKTGKTVSTTAPTEAKTYRVYVVGKNGYAGKKQIGTYTIPKYDMQYVTVSVSMASAASVPSVTVKSIYENITFVKDKDYTVYYSTNISNGKVYVSVTPTADGNLTGSSKGGSYPIVAKSIASCSVSFTNGRSSAAYTGSTIPVDVTVKDGYYTTLTKGTHYTVTYKNAAGTKVTSIRDAGTYTVEINGIGGYNGTTYLTFTVIGTDISGYTVTLKEASVNATGYAQTPVISSVKKGYYYSLTSNDYTVTYQDSTGKTVTSMSAPGTYKVVVTGKNGYSGSTYATFRIVGLPQTVTVTQDSYKVYATSDSFKITAKASGDATGFTYTSSNPAVASVSAAGYVTMHKVGRAVITVTATGMKKYEPAYETVEVKVYPKKAVMTKKPWTDGKKYQAKVRWTYQDGATSYQVRYSRDKNFGAGTYKTKTVKAHGKDYTTQSTTLKSLKSKSTYYIKVRAVYTDPVTGDTYYGAWSGWRSVKTK